MPETPTRKFRIPEDLWLKAKAQAEEEHTTVTALVIRALRRELQRR